MFSTGSFDASLGLGPVQFNKRERKGKRAELPENLARKIKSCSVLGCEDWRDLSSKVTYHWYVSFIVCIISIAKNLKSS